MDLQLLNAIINGGGTAMIVYMLYDMRKQQNTRDQQIWALLEWLIKQTPGIQQPPGWPPAAG